ncbi:MAG: hypothetical protein WD851_24670 [Pirellulales bacterium]
MKSHRICVLCALAVLLANPAGAQPPIATPAVGGVGLNVPLNTNLNVSGWGVNQFLGNGFLMDGIAARTNSSPGLARFARYQTGVQGQSTPTAMPANQDWAIEIGYKHTGAYSSINSPFFVKNFGEDDRFVALLNNGGDNWSLGVGNATGGYDMAASQIALGTGWNRFNFHYKAATQSIDAYLNNKLIAADVSLGHGQYNPDHVQIEFTGAGTDWFGDIKIGNAVPRTRSVNFGNEWVRSNPFTLQGTVARANSLNDTLYRDALFTNVLAFEGDVGLVDKAWEIQGLPWHWHTGEQLLGNPLKFKIQTWMVQRPGGEGFVVWDEPTRTEFQGVREVTDWIKHNYPETLVYGNLNTIGRVGANYAQEYGSDPNPPPVPYDYATFVDDYMYVVQPDVLQSDIYPISDDPGELTPVYLHDRYYRFMETIRSAGQKADVPYFVFVQTFDGGGTRLPSESELRFQTFAALAYGFKGISYFVFDHFGAFSSGNQGGMLRALDDSETMYSVNPIYYDVQELNPELARLGETLKMMDSTKVRYVLGTHLLGGQEVLNDAPLGVTLWNPASDEPFITSMEATYAGSIPGVERGDLLMGHFETALEELDGAQFENELYFMVVNLLIDQTLDATQTIHMEFDFGASGINSLQRLNRLTGSVEVVPLIHDGGSLYHLDFSLAGGTGDLFKYNTGTPFIVGMGIAGLPGDYNGNGIVDAADYVVWRDSRGQQVPHGTGADGDGDGTVGQGDHNFWRARFGNGGGTGSLQTPAVPEPAAFVLAILAGIGFMSWRRRD